MGPEGPVWVVAKRMLLRFSEIELPLDLKANFGREGPLVMEVGAGDGRFLVGLAQAAPHWNILGVELSAASVERALRRLRREGVGQVRLFKGSGDFALKNLVPPRSLDAVYVNFPDPWPKKRHAQRRLLRVPFFRLLSTRLVDGGRLLLTTDHREYFEQAIEEAKKSGLFEVEIAPPPPLALTTKYATKWRQAGRTFYHAVFSKIAEDAATYPVIERWKEMPHAIFEGPVPSAPPNEKRVFEIPGGHVIFLEFTPRPREGFYAFVRVEEEALVQEVVLEVRPSGKGVYAGLKRFGDPLVTPGVRRATGHLADMLKAQGLVEKQASY